MLIQMLHIFDDAFKGLKAQLSEMEKARKFIFMEYHAIQDTPGLGNDTGSSCKKGKAGSRSQGFL